MKRKVFSILALLCIAVTSAWADDSGSCGTSLTYSYVESTHTLTISGSGAMTKYNLFMTKAPWDGYKASITSVVIESGVTSIGEYAFNQCTSLASVTIPTGVTSIGRSAFEQCSNLTTIDIPASVESIGNGAFGRTGLTEITIPASVMSIGQAAFSGCSNLKSANLPDNLTSIPSQLFYQCTSLEAITIPASVTKIESSAFYGCNNASLTTITIPASVTSIGSQAFRNCTGLTSVDLPAKLTEIGVYAFYGCNNASLTSISIPASVTSIGQKAFMNCSNLATVTINAPSLTTYGTGAFDDAASGLKIYVPAGCGDTYKAGWADYASKIEEMADPAATDLSTLNADYTAQDGDVLTGTLDGSTQKFKISIADGATVTLDGMTINGVTDGAADASLSTVNWAGLTCEGNATIILKEGTTNTVRGFYHRCPGIFVPQGYTLTIDGTGTLNASGSISTEANHVDKSGNLITCAPGIGSAVLATAGNIVINGGTINATGGWASASIGGNFLTGCGNITITGGTVNATGSLAAAGIGGGWVASCGDIAITGGTIYATGGDYINSDATGNDGGPAIGGSPCGSCGTITIGGTANVTVTKGLGAPYSIGQGGSWNNVSASCGTVTVFGVEGQISNSPYTCISLSEESDNSKTLTMYDGQTADVNLTRTLAAGSWNTLALPFNVESTTLAAINAQLALMSGSMTVKELTSSSFENGTLTLNFTTATSIKAGTPYLVKVTTPVALAGMPFAGAEVSKTVVPTETDAVDFIPTLGRTQVTADKESVLFLGAGNTLLSPSDDGQYIKGFRAYFQLKGDAIGAARSFSLNLGDGETTGIQTLGNFTISSADNSVYDLSGRKWSNSKLSNGQMPKGVYIVNGKKVSIK